MYLFVAMFLFGVSFVVHFVTWKVRLPQRQMKALLVIFAAIFCLWLVYSVLHSSPLFELLQVALFYFSITLCYLTTYSAIEGGSPTLSLMRFLAERWDTGRSEQEVMGFLSDRAFVKARLAALVCSGLVREDGGTYVIAGKRSLAFRVILAYQKLYGHISKGG